MLNINYIMPRCNRIKDLLVHWVLSCVLPTNSKFTTGRVVALVGNWSHSQWVELQFLFHSTSKGVEDQIGLLLFCRKIMWMLLELGSLKIVIFFLFFLSQELFSISICSVVIQFLFFPIVCMNSYYMTSQFYFSQIWSIRIDIRED